MTVPTPAPRFGEGLGFAARRLPRRRLAEEEATAAAHALHQPAAAGAGGDLSEESLPRHEYARRDRRVDQPHRGPRAGTQPRRCPPPPPSPPFGPPSRGPLSRQLRKRQPVVLPCLPLPPTQNPTSLAQARCPHGFLSINLQFLLFLHLLTLDGALLLPLHYLWFFSSPLLDPLLLPSPPPQYCHP